MHTHFPRLLLLATIHPLLCIAATDDNLYAELPVVLSASRLDQPTSEAPLAVTIIDRDTIAASGARTIPDVLRLVPGMIVGNSANEFGDEPKIVVAYHGHTDQYSRQMQVLIDGRSIYEPMLGGVNWNMLPINLEDIERIEVTRGPNASSYGSNSFLAVINVITRHAAEDIGQLFKASAGNHDIVDLTYRFGGQQDDVDYRITVSTQNDDGQDTVNGTANHDDAAAKAIDYRIDYQLSNAQQLTYQGAYGQTTLDADQNYASGGIKPVRDSDNMNAYQFLKFENIIDDENSFVLQYYYNLLDKSDQSTSRPVVPGAPFDTFTLPLDFSLKSARHNVEFTHDLQPTEDVRLIWGLGAQRDTGQSAFLLGTTDELSRRIYRLFSNVEWHLGDKDILNIGIQYEHNQSIAAATSPRLSYIHKFTPRHSVRLGVSKSTRSPFITEEHSNTSLMQELTSGGVATGIILRDVQLLPAPDLDNEIIISRDIGYYGRYLNDDLLFNTRIFRDTISHLVRLSPVSNPPGDNLDSDADTYINDNSTIVSGIEAEIDFYLDPTLRVTSSGTVMDIKINDPVPNLRSIDYQQSAPDKTAAVIIMKNFNERYSSSMGFYYVGNFSWIDAHNSVPNQYRKLDIKLSRHFHSNGDKATLSLVLQNLLEDYNNYDSTPDNGPVLEQNLTAYLEFRLRLK